MKHWKVKIPGKEGRPLLHHAVLVQALSDHFLLCQMHQFPLLLTLKYYYRQKKCIIGIIYNKIQNMKCKSL